jgi:hypothetical protein
MSMEKITLFIILLLCMVMPAQAWNVHFRWGESSGQVDGYRIYWGNATDGPYSNQLCDVNGTTFDYYAALNAFQKYWLICRAYNEYGESGDSNEVHWPNHFRAISTGGLHSAIAGGGLVQ